MFVKTVGFRYGDFHWQNGDRMLSVGPTRVPEVEAYARGQEERQGGVSFHDESRAFLARCRMAYDERYVWD